jgi:hypothetical protein
MSNLRTNSYSIKEKLVVVFLLEPLHKIRQNPVLQSVAVAVAMDSAISTSSSFSPLRLSQNHGSIMSGSTRAQVLPVGRQQQQPPAGGATRLRAVSPSPSPTPPAPQPAETFGFDALKEAFSVDVVAAEARPLNVPLAAPFTIASSRLDAVSNVAVRVELRSGAVGWGEAPVLPSVTAEDQPGALAAATRACGALAGAPAAPLGAVLQDVASALPGHDFASVRHFTQSRRTPDSNFTLIVVV